MGQPQEQKVENQTVVRGDVAYPDWSPANASRIQEQMGRPVGEALIAVDATSHIVFANAGMSQLFGWEPEELVGLPLNAVIPQRHHKDHLGHVAAFMSTNSAGRTIDRPGLNARQRSGYTFECTLRIARVGSPDGPILLASIRPRGRD